MPEIMSSALRDQKNLLENKPIFLYEIMVPGNPIYLAAYDIQVIYPTSGGLTYLPFPIGHEGTSLNIQGEIDTVKIAAANVSRYIGGLMIANDGLRGTAVTIRLVFADLLSDPEANFFQTFYIDSCEIDENNVVITCTGKLDLYEVQLPRRRYMRDHCEWQYKKEGCWLWTGGVWTAPAAFTNTATVCDKTRRGPYGCEFHTNQLRFGGFPSIPTNVLYVS